MPILSTVDHARGEVHAIAVGPVSFEDVRNHLSQQRHWQCLQYPEFIDGRAAEPTFTQAEVHLIVDLLRTLSRDAALGRTAVLVATDYAFGVMRMLETLVEDICDVRPFRDEQEARAWIAMK